MSTLANQPVPAEPLPEPPVPNVDPASGFPEARREPTHHSTAQARDDQGRFTAEDIEKARSQERDKLYDTIEKEREARKTLEEQVQVLMSEREAEQKKRDEEQAALDQAAQQQQASEEAKRREQMEAKDIVTEVEQRFLAQIRELQEDRDRERILREKESELNNLTTYRDTRLAEESANIAPQFLEYVTGESQEQIESSIERAKKKTEEIKLEFEAFQTNQRQQLPGSRITQPAVGPLEVQESTRQMTNEELKNLPMSEYAKLRSQLGIGGRGRGLLD